MLDLLLINPSSGTKMYQKVTSSLRGIEPPFWAGLIASFIRKHGYSVAILDADAENLSPNQAAEEAAHRNPEVTAIIVQGVNPSASSTPKMSATSDLLKLLKIKAPETFTILGGLHPSALPERTLKEEKVDFVCQGEGFYTILDLLQWLRAGKSGDNIPGLHYKIGKTIVSNPSPRAELLSPAELPPVAWDLLDMSKYRAHNWHCLADIDHRSPYGVIYTSLGCPYDCDFCQIKQLYSGKPGIRFRKPEEVIKEIDLLVNKYGVRHIKIMDELFVINEKRVASVCDPIIERGYDLNMWAYARVDKLTKPMLEKMKKAGINWIGYGIEGGDQKVRQGVGKSFSQEQIRKAVEVTHEAGINIAANFIFGLPEDRMETMQTTFSMMCEYNFEWVNLYCATAYPGSILYENAIKQGIPLPKTWDGYSQLGYEFLPLPTEFLPAREVLRFRDDAFQEYFSRPKYLNMISNKFGEKAVEHIQDMLKHEVHRKWIH